MTPMGRTRTVALGLAALLLASSVMPSARANASPTGDMQDRALAIIAARAGVPASELRVLLNASATYPEQGLTLPWFKIYDPGHDRVYTIAIDATGSEADLARAAAAERDMVRQRRGALDPQLAQRIATAPATELIDVTIVVSAPAHPAPAPTARDASAAVLDAFVRDSTARRHAEVAAGQAPIRSALEGQGFRVDGLADEPVLAARLPVAVIRSLARTAGVVAISEQARLSQSLSVSRRAIGVDGVNGRGVTGSGVQAAIIEIGGRYNAANPYLAGLTQDAGTECDNDHATNVAGVIHSTNVPNTGMATGSSLWVGGDCNGVDLQMQRATTTAKDWGAHVMNNSWGFTAFQNGDMGSLERFQDDFVRDYRTTVTVSAGNAGTTGCPQGSSGYVLGPAKAYSVIAVGASNMRGSPVWPVPSDTAMYNCSSYLNPNSTSHDRQKPELTAPGVGITTTSQTGLGVFDGTSLAAPMVAGVAVLLQQRNATLKTWPETVKAILLASALTNIEGAARLSDKDGAGQIQANRADDIVTNGQYATLNHICTDPLDRVLFTARLEAWTRTRITLAWATDTDDNTPGWFDYVNRPSADLDLFVYDSVGNAVATSTSADNTYELVDFKPTSTGTYTVKARTIRCDSGPWYVGAAWIQDNGFAPGVARFSSGTRMDVVVRGRDNAIYQRTSQGSWTGTSWGSLGTPGSGATSNPYAVWWQNNNRLDVFVRGSDNTVWQRFFCFTVSQPACASIGWAPWNNVLGGVLTEGPPTAAWTTGNRIDLLVRGAGGANHVLWQYWDGTGWSGWIDIGPTEGVTSAPAAVWWQNNTRLDVFARGPNSTLYERFYCTQLGSACGHTGWSTAADCAESLSDWCRVPLPLASIGSVFGPGVAVSAPTTGDRIDVFVRGSDDLFWQTYWAPAAGGWTDWVKLTGATFISGPGAGWWSDNTKVDVLGQATDDQLWYRSSSDGIWRAIDVYPPP